MVKSILISISKFKSLLLLNWLRINKNYLFAFIDSHVVHYFSPSSLTYAWSFGSLAGLSLVIQIIPDIFLSMHYVSHIDLALNSVDFSIN